MRKLAGKIARAALRAMPLERAVSLSLRGGKLGEIAWSFVLENEDRLPEKLRGEVSQRKWRSAWFFNAWFSKPVHLDHMEARHRLFRIMRELCAANPQIRTIDDLGCVNGTFLRDAALIFPTLDLRGWEMSELAVAKLRARFPGQCFLPTDLDALIADSAGSIITTSGTLQYFSEGELAAFFAKLAAAPHDTFLAIAEISEFKLADMDRSTYRRYQTYNHSYPALLKNAGFEISSAETFAMVPGIDWVVLSAQRRGQ